MLKNLVVTKVAGICLAGSLAATVLAGCGTTTSSTSSDTSSSVSTSSSASDGSSSASSSAEFDSAAALQVLLDANPAKDNRLVLSGIVGGWAPTVLVLDNDGNFTALVDYAGQATVNFATGTYEENADGSITCTGTQYNTGDTLTYEISKDDDAYSVDIAVPDTGSTGTLTGTAA